MDILQSQDNTHTQKKYIEMAPSMRISEKVGELDGNHDKLEAYIAIISW